MAKSAVCDGWYKLIFGKNRGQIYDRFKREQKELTDHLDHCDICKNFLLQIDPMPTLLANKEWFKSLSPADFAYLIRVVYAKAQSIGLKEEEEDDSVCMDHD